MRVWPQILFIRVWPQKMGKTPFKSIFEKILSILNSYNLKNKLISYGTWFIFELIGVGKTPDLSETQAFKNVCLQMVTDETFTFLRIFF